MVRQLYQDEIESLHAFFVDWFHGTVERSAIDRLSHALHEDFEMVPPSGERLDRATVIEGIRDRYGTAEAFAIEIANVDVRFAWSDRALVRYEEWQTTEAGRTGRLSTVLFARSADAEHRLQWLDLHETWLVPPSA